MVKNLPSVERSTKIRFGKHVPDSNDQEENTIVFNASNVVVPTPYSNAVYLSPIRNRTDYQAPEIVLLMYDRNTKEITESGESANALIGGSTFDTVVNRNNATSNTVQYIGALNNVGFVTSSNVGLSNLDPQHTVSVGSNLYIDEFGSNVLVVSGNVAVLKDMTVEGNLTVNGGTTLIYTENTSIKDAFIELGRDNTSGDTTLDLGVLMHRPDALSNVVIGYREGNDEFAIAYTDAQPTDKTFTPKTDEDINVHVYGLTHVDANIYAHEDVLVDGNVYVSGNTSVTEELTVSGNVYADKDLEVVGNVYVDGNVVAYKDLTLSGNAYVSGNVNISNQLSVSDNVYVSGNVEVTESLIVSANTHLKGDNVFITHTMDFLDPTTAIVTDQVSNVQIRLGQLENVANTASNPLINQVLTYDQDNSEWSNAYPDQTIVLVKNTSGALMTRGQAVHVTGSNGNNMFEVELADASDASKMPAIGIVYENIPINGEGAAVTFGRANGIDGISEFTNGDTLYVASGTPGGLTNVKPYGVDLDLIQNIGVVVNNSSGVVFVTGIGRANDIPNARIITDYNDMQYVYVNSENNDLKKIASENLNIPLTTAVSSSSNSVANAITLRGLTVTTDDDYNGNVNIGGNVSISGLTNKYVPYISTTNKYLRNSQLYQEDSSNKMVFTGDVEISGDLVVQGTQVVIENADLVVQDRIIDVANNNIESSLDIGILMEYPQKNIGIIHHEEGELAIGYTQNGYADSHIIRDVGNVITVDVHGNLITQNTLSVNEEIRIYDGGLGINIGGTDVTQLDGMKMLVDGDIKIGKDYDVFYVDVSEGSVGLSTTTPTSNLHIVGNAFITSNITTTSNVIIKGDAVSTSKTTGALQVTGGVGVLGDIYAADCNFEDVEADTVNITNADESTSKTTGALKITGGVGVGTNLFSRSLYMDDYLTHIGDLNTKIGFPDVDTFTVTTNNLERVRVDSSGRVGIYTNTPNSNIHVEGNAFITSNITTSSNILVNGDASSTSITTGAIQVANGIGVKSNIHSTNVFAVSHITVGTSETSNALDIRGTANVGQLTVTGMSSEGNVYAHKDLIVKTGNLYVTGNTTTSGYTQAYGMKLGAGGLSIGNLFSAGPGAVPGVGSVNISGIVESLAFRTAHDSGYNTGIANTSPDNTFSVGANAYINAYGTTILSVTGNTVTTNLLADSHIAVGTSAPTHPLDIRGSANVAALTAHSLDITDTTTSTSITNGALTVAGGVSTQENLNVGEVTKIWGSNPSTNKTTGALQVVGGVGVQGALYGANANLEDVEADSVNVTDTTAATNKTSGALQVVGGVGVQGALYGAAATFDGVTSVTNATAATNKTSGALKVTGGVGVSGALYGAAATFDGVTSVTNATASTSKTTGALKVTGGAGIQGDIYAAGARFDNLNVAPDSDIIAKIGRAAIGYFGHSSVADKASFGHVDKIGLTTYGIRFDTNGQVEINSVGSQGIVFKNDNNIVNVMTGTNNCFGVNTSDPRAKLHVHGGTITNSDQVAKKTYSYTGDLANGQTIANSTIKITFSNHTFSARIMATLVESDDEVSTLSFECGGGNWIGSVPSSLNIVTGPVNVFGNTSTNPWDATITTTPTTVSFKPSTTMADNGHYNVFIEYFSSSSLSGKVTKITEGTTDQVTFTY